MNFSFNWSAVSGGAPYVTISTLGIAFNSTSITRLGNPDRVVVGFDEDQCVIGVKAYDGDLSIKPYEFSSRIRNGWIRIGCRDFVKYLQTLTNIDFSTSKRYVGIFDAESSILIVYVKGEAESSVDAESGEESDEYR